MKKAVRILSVVMALVICLSCFAGCKKIDSEREAIEVVKAAEHELKHRIADEFDFSINASIKIEYRFCFALQEGENWVVKVLGAATGSRKMNEVYRKYFEIDVTVDSKGKIIKYSEIKDKWGA